MSVVVVGKGRDLGGSEGGNGMRGDDVSGFGWWMELVRCGIGRFRLVH